MADNEAGDKAQIGLTAAAAQQLDDLMERGYFADRQDAYRVAIGVALARRIAASTGDLAGVQTRYNFAGGVDRDGQVRDLIGLLHPDQASRPAAFAERLAHAGIDFLHAALSDDTRMLCDVLVTPEPDDAPPDTSVGANTSRNETGAEVSVDPKAESARPTEE